MRRFAKSTCPVRTHHVSFVLNDFARCQLRRIIPFASYSAPRVHQKFSPQISSAETRRLPELGLFRSPLQRDSARPPPRASFSFPGTIFTGNSRKPVLEFCLLSQVSLPEGGPHDSQSPGGTQHGRSTGNHLFLRRFGPLHQRAAKSSEGS